MCVSPMWPSIVDINNCNSDKYCPILCPRSHLIERKVCDLIHGRYHEIRLKALFLYSYTNHNIYISVKTLDQKALEVYIYIYRHSQTHLVHTPITAKTKSLKIEKCKKYFSNGNIAPVHSYIRVVPAPRIENRVMKLYLSRLHNLINSVIPLIFFLNSFGIIKWKEYFICIFLFVPYNLTSQL